VSRGIEMKSYIPDNGLTNHQIQEDNIDDGIMIVDDSKFSRNILRDILVKENFKVIAEAKNGLEAIELTKEKKPKYIFMDVEMPMLDGLGAIPLILKIDPNIHIIMCTAMGQKNIIVEAARAGAKDYVLKPYKKENIIRVLNVIIESHQENEKKKLEEAELDTEQKTNATDDVYEDVTDEVDIMEEELKKNQETFIAEVAATVEDEHNNYASEVSVTLEEELDIIEVEESISFDDVLKDIEEFVTTDNVQDKFDVDDTDVTDDIYDELDAEEINDNEFVREELASEETVDREEVLKDFDTENTYNQEDKSEEFDVTDEVETEAIEDVLEALNSRETDAIEDVLEALNSRENDDIEDVLEVIEAGVDYEQAYSEGYDEIDMEATDAEVKAIEFDEAAEEVRKALELSEAEDIKEVLKAFEAADDGECNEEVLVAFMADSTENNIEVLEALKTDYAEDMEVVLVASEVDTAENNDEVLDAYEADTSEDSDEVLEVFESEGVEDNEEVQETFEAAETEVIDEAREVDTENIQDILELLEAVDLGEDVVILEAYDEDETTDNEETKDTETKDTETKDIETKGIIAGIKKVLHLEELPSLDKDATVPIDYYRFSYLWNNRFDGRQETFSTTKPVHKRISFQKVAFSTSFDKYISREEDSNVIIMSGMINAYLSVDNRLQQEDNNYDKQISTYTEGIRLLSTNLLEEEAKDGHDFTMSDFLLLSAITKPNKININKSIFTTTISQLVQGKSNALCNRIN
jgi:two-component system chemotaxis response regulator CheY